MVRDWLAALFAAPATTRPMPLQLSKFGIGVCPGCRQLRQASSLCCEYCSSTVRVTEDH